MSALEGLDLPPLRENYTPLEAVVLVKALDEEGELVLCHLRTKDLTAWEALGMTISAADDLRAALRMAEDDES